MNTSKLTTKLNVAIMSEVASIVDKFNITNPLRLSHFLSQCAHESANFTALRENLNYSIDGLLKIFPKYFKDRANR